MSDPRASQELRLAARIRDRLGLERGDMTDEELLRMAEGTVVAKFSALELAWEDFYAAVRNTLRPSGPA